VARANNPSAGEVEESIDSLFQLPLDQFTAERNALAATLKKAGDKAAAERVKALTKPNTTAWAINQVWWKHRDRFEAMLDAGAAQRKAHLALAQGRAADVRGAGEARREAVSEVADAALDVLGGKKSVPPDVQYRIAGTLEALASSGVPEGETLGRLSGDLQSSGLDALAALAEAAGSTPRPRIVARGTPAPARPTAPPTRPAVKSPAAAADAGEARREETARDRKAADAATARAAAIAQAESRHADLAAALERAEGAVVQAARDETEARETLDAATARRDELESALDEARAAEAAARREVSSATAARSRAEMDRGRAARDVERAREALDRAKR
jgi:hypothetical protein